jgi:RNA-directed DNA polymerase
MGGKGDMTKTPSSLQDLSKSLYDKAKAEPTKRFWGLYVHVCKMETLQEAYEMAKKNDGAPGIDGVTFEVIEERGAERFLQQIRDELITNTYRPMRVRKKEIPKDGGKVRILSIPSIRDRVVQGALKLILEPIFEADFQAGSYGYRPKRTAHEAINRVAQAIVEEKTKIIDLDLRAYFDNVQHSLLLEKVAKRVQDDAVMRLLKMILKATGKKGVPQGGVISPLISNVYLNEIDKMLEKAIETTCYQQYTAVQYARFADDLVVLVDSHARHSWIVPALKKTTAGGIREAQSGDKRGEKPNGGPQEEGKFRIPGVRLSPHPKSQRGVAAAVYAKAEEANGGAGEAQGHFLATCEPTGGEGDRDDQPNSSRVGELLCGRACGKMLHVYQRLGGKEDSATSDACAEVQGVRLEAME